MGEFGHDGWALWGVTEEGGGAGEDWLYFDGGGGVGLRLVIHVL